MQARKTLTIAAIAIGACTLLSAAPALAQQTAHHHAHHMKADKRASHHHDKASAQSPSSDRAFWAQRARQCDALVGEAQNICNQRRSQAAAGGGGGGGGGGQ